MSFEKDDKFEFGNYLTINWDDVEIDSVENNIHSPLLKKDEDYVKEQVVTDFLQNKYPDLVIDRYKDKYELFFTETDYEDFESWCKYSLHEGIEYWEVAGIIRCANKFNEFIKLELLEFYIYKILYRIIIRMKNK